MPSRWNGYEENSLLNCGVYPLRRTSRFTPPGPAPRMDDMIEEDEEEPEDIVDETLYLFKPHMFFRTFPINGAGDRVILYLTMYLHECLKKINSLKREEANSALLSYATTSFASPGEKDFPLNAFFPSGSDSGRERWREYAKQLRVEAGARLIEKVFLFPELNGTGNKFWMAFAKRSFLPSVLWLTTTVTAEDDIVANMNGNWSILWLRGQYPRQTGYVADVSTTALVLRKAAMEQSVVVAYADSLLRYIGLLEKEKEEDSFQWTSSRLAVGKSYFPEVVNTHVANESIHLADCGMTELNFPLPQFPMETPFRMVFEHPQTISLPDNDGTCSQIPFAVQGYWMELLDQNEILMVLMIRTDGEDFNVVFQLRRRLKETELHSFVTPLALLLVVALKKGLLTTYWRGRKRESVKSGKAVPNIIGPLLSEVHKRELLQKQDEIIRRMKEMDGKL